MRRWFVQLPARLLALCALAVSTLAACSIDPDANMAFGCDGCPTDACVMGFCFRGGADVDSGTLGDDGGIGVGNGGNGGGGAGTGDGGSTPPPPPEDCDEPGKTEFCYQGPGDTATTGSCKAGMRVCGEQTWGPCLGQVLPEEEQCNREDDDCDGNTDEELALGTCRTGQFGTCDEGTLRCESGVAVCARATDPGAEACNGDDDDCDGEVDEELSPVCYPAAPSGCMDDGAGGFICMGLCVAGVAACVDGVPQACDGQIEPATEECGSSGGPTAQDEDCDGQADNGCTCGSGDSQACYDGPIETLDVGICHAGTQACDGGTFGPCMDEVLPGMETCANETFDDDCNDVIDDVRDRGTPCTLDDAMGVCSDGTHQCKDGALTCVGPDPVDETCNGLDDDCDGPTDEGLIGTDMHCAQCNEPCSVNDPGGADTNGPNCCSGNCVDFQTDPLNCGRCGNDCGEGLSCCSGQCTNTNSDALNCAMCGHACPLGGCCQDAKCSAVVICL